MREFQITKLPGGLRVVTESMPRIRSVSLGFWIGAGSRDESSEQAGISHFLEHLLFKGNNRYSARDIAETFDSIGAESNAYTSKEYTVVLTRCLDEHLERAFDLSVEMVLRPEYLELDTEREVILEEIAMYEDEPQDKVHDIFSEAVFGGHALGRPVIGSAGAVGALTVEQMADYHDARYLPANMVVGAAGSVDHDALVELVSDEAGFVGGDNVKRSKRSTPEALQPRGLFYRKPTDQYHLCIGAPGIARSDDRRFALTLLDSIFGGSISSRLFQEIREKRGLAYSVYSYSGQYQDTGHVGVYVGTRAENVTETMRIISAELERLQDDPASDEELERAKEHFKGRFVLSMESSSTRMGRLGTSVLCGIEILSMDEVIARVDAVTVDDLRDLAQSFYRPEMMSAAGIGENEELFRGAMESINQRLTTVA